MNDEPFTIELLTGTPLDGRAHRLMEPGTVQSGPVTTVVLAYADTASAAGVIEWVGGDRVRVLDATRVAVAGRHEVVR